MKKLLKILGGLVGLLVVVVIGAVVYFSMTWGKTYPDTPTPQISAVDDTETIARGRYVFHTVGHCTACHAPRDEVYALEQGGELVPRGGELPIGPLATLRPANLTNSDKYGIGRYTDPELARIIRHGVKPDDTVALFMMASGPLADEDLTALISYMRTLEPVDEEVPPSEVSAMGKILMQTAMSFAAEPKPIVDTPPYVPPGEVSAERGKYLTHGPGVCFGCHSNAFAENFDESKYFCGNPQPWSDEEGGGKIFAPNLTTHETAGKLAGMSEEQFLVRLRAPRIYKSSPMPWENYRGMTDEDLRSIYQYLISREPCDRDVGPVYQES